MPTAKRNIIGLIEEKPQIAAVDQLRKGQEIIARFGGAITSDLPARWCEPDAAPGDRDAILEGILAAIAAARRAPD